MPILSQSKSYPWTSMPPTSSTKTYYWTSMPIISQQDSNYCASMPRISQSEKLLYVLSHLAGLFFIEQLRFLEILDMSSFEQCAFLACLSFSENGLQGQTSMLSRRAAKFRVEARSPFSNISHHNPTTLGKPPNIISWPESQPEFPDDAHGGGDASTFFG